MFIQWISDQKPLVDKLNKTGEALIRLVNEDDGVKVQDILDGDNARYSALRAQLRQRQQALEQALQVSISSDTIPYSSFSHIHRTQFTCKRAK